MKKTTKLKSKGSCKKCTRNTQFCSVPFCEAGTEEDKGKARGQEQDEACCGQRGNDKIKGAVVRFNGMSVYMFSYLHRL
ncbi:unnamed protein product [Linum tenue]|uniref:Uncharacterized protein n=1 Tax=Linum tenue TaxID=586396 RepID=A0AAV0J488_9ROSI|nr:unnamed protein product [Linum tenue]CAI0431722.1 unnamed protein product [Linum tenue]CAI0431726.1 unnamed protein product [Linum tenue]CAI0462020.1 unnamed protein product [Linum tenue]